MSDRGFTKRHLQHGAMFLIAGVFMFGSYMVLGVDTILERMGPAATAGLCMVAFGIFLLLPGQRILDRPSWFREYYDAIVLAVGIALFVRTFIIEPFKIPSGSMIPTLLVGDYLFVNKLAYGHRIPFTRDRVLFGHGPQRGDIAVFEYPREPNKDYIKRIIGLPGDRIVYDHKRLVINGKPVAYETSGPFSYKNEHTYEVNAERRLESIGKGAYSILVQPQLEFMDRRTETVVPPGHYFVMGDNRDNSNDSRVWGFVPSYRLVGKAVALFWSWDSHASSPRWYRVASAVE
ncbi:MAG: signal peptidase I [Magnetococcales bacterium]|nr:signal peptidase I [Magnetococcales bacterium]MBF0323407.1 signal peptidase I [Magnetococcales bacterium]